MADTNYTNLKYLGEGAVGTDPFKFLRRTGGNIQPQRSTTVSEEIRSDLRAGKPVRTAEWAEGSVNVEWSYGSFDDILEGLLMENWASNVLVDGTTKKDYLFEDQIVDPSITAQYMIYRNCRIQEVTMSLALESIVTGSFGVLGRTPSIAQTSADTSGQVSTPVSSTEVFNTVNMVEALEDGAAGSTPATINRIQGIDLTITRNLRRKHEIGALNPYDIGVGRLEVAGSITEYFESERLMDEWFSFADRTLVMELQDGAGNNLRVEIPKFKMTGNPAIDIPGPDGDVVAQYDFTAYADTGDAALIRFTRTPA